LPEKSPLPVSRRVVAKEVEPRLADGDDRAVPEHRLQLFQALRVRAGGLVRVDAENAGNVLVLPRDLEHGPAGVDAGADREHAGHAGRPSAVEENVGRLLARVEMRVRVDHAAAGASRRGKSGGAGTMSFSSPSLPEAICCQATSSGRPRASRIAADVRGTNAWSATATQRSASARS